jgi:hypothetical protein
VRRTDNPVDGRPATPAEMTELVDNIRLLRLTLTADLAAAAAAVEAADPAVARDIIAADRRELRRLSGHVPPPRRLTPTRRRRRTLVALPAVPLIGALAMTGAVALTSRSVHDQRATARPTATTVTAERPSTLVGRQAHAGVTSPPTLLGPITVGRLPHSPAARAVDRHTEHSIPPPVAAAKRPRQVNKVKHLLRVEQQLFSPVPVPTPTPTATSQPLSGLAVNGGTG